MVVEGLSVESVFASSNMAPSLEKKSAASPGAETRSAGRWRVAYPKRGGTNSKETAPAFFSFFVFRAPGGQGPVGLPTIDGPTYSGDTASSWAPDFCDGAPLNPWTLYTAVAPCPSCPG